MKPTRAENQYKKFIQSKPCLGCGSWETEAHHHRTSTNAGMGTRPSDFYMLPMCRLCHSQLHTVGENTFWNDAGKDPLPEIIALLSEYVEAQDKRVVPF